MKTCSRYFIYLFALLFTYSLHAQVSDTTLQGFSPYKFGASINISLLKNNVQYRALVAREFNSLTAENAMKFGAIHPSQNTYSWADGDTLVNFAQQYGKRVHGHTLLWHNNVPSWVTNFSGDSVAWENLVRDHITTVVTHYKGKLTSWDVVNEAFNDDGTLRSTIWSQHLGPNYIARAFQYAHAADTAALLFYNDYGHEYSTAKLAAIQNLVNTLKAAGIPIHGVGLQTHINKNSSNPNISRGIDSMLSTGLLLHISELDIAMNPENNLSLTYTDPLANQQFGKYKFISRLVKKIPQDKFYGITTWDVTDADSWIPGTYSRPDFPLPFNSSYQKKLAYQGIKDGITGSWNFDAAGGQSIAGVYTDLGSTGTAINTNYAGVAMTYDNDHSSIQDIGFSFIFNGSVYNKFVLNTNGYIKLGGSSASANNIFIATASGNTGSVISATDIDVLYPYNHDLMAGSGTPEYRVATIGVPGSRVCTIQFKNVADKLAPIQYSNMEFQVKLYETTNNIEFVYGTWLASANTSALTNAAIGIKGISATESVNVAKGSSVPWTTAMSTANNYYFKNGDYPLAGPLFGNRNGFLPDAGRIYRFSPQAVILPVRLLDFTANDLGKNIVLQWRTTNEVNNQRFEVERSSNGSVFLRLADVAASANATTYISTYAYMDIDAPIEGPVFYRLKQVDKDGTVSFSPIVKINRQNLTSLSVKLVNPFHNQLSMQLQARSQEAVSLRLLNEKGCTLYSKMVDIGPGVSSLRLPLGALANGAYYLVIRSAGFNKTIVVIKN